jgi:multimeric flavodoxin WrbA/GNAT superfamily N-acetyltransferase
MKVTCISASNIKHKKHDSTSIHACRLIEEIVLNYTGNSAILEVLPLTEYEPNPCIGCGDCYKANKCTHDEAFNTIYQKIQDSDCLFIVSPHYAPIPVKLSMILEKIEEMAYLHWFHDNSFKAALYNKPVGIIGHGGSDDRSALSAYKRVVLDNIADALQTSMLDVVGNGDTFPNGVIFMMDKYTKDETGIFPIQTYDWNRIRIEIAPLVEKVMKKLERVQVYIEKACECDAEVLTHIQARTFYEDTLKFRGVKGGPPGVDSIDWTLDMISRAHYFKVLSNKRIIGGIIVFNLGNGLYELGRIFIDTDYQSKGIGQKVIDLLHNSFIDATKWRLETPEWALRNHHFYEKMGYKKIGVEGPIPEGFTLFVYERCIG